MPIAKVSMMLLSLAFWSTCVKWGKSVTTALFMLRGVVLAFLLTVVRAVNRILLVLDGSIPYQLSVDVRDFLLNWFCTDC